MSRSRTATFLVLCDASAEAVASIAGVVDQQPLEEGRAWLVEASTTRSQLYHDLKSVRPAGGGLLVAELVETPKFSGMASGSTTWARDRLPTHR